MLAKHKSNNAEEIIDAMQDAVCITDLGDKIVRVNAVMEGLFGINKAKFLTMKGYDLTPVENHETIRRAVKKMLETGDPQGLELTGQFGKAKGREFWMQMSLLKNKKGEPCQIVTVTRDITEKNTAKKALLESEQNLRLAFENIKDAMFWIEPDTGVIIKCNRAAEDLVEKNKVEIVGFDQSKLYPPSKADLYTDLFNDHIQKKGSVDEEAEVLTKSGQIKLVHITAMMTLIGGQPIIVGIFRDITNRKRLAEKIARQSKDELVSILENSYDVIFKLTLDGYIEYVNQRAMEIYGYNPEDLIGKHIKRTTTNEDLPNAMKAIMSVISGEEVYNLKINQVDAKGNMIPMEARLTAVKEEDRVVGVQGIMRNLDGRECVEAEETELEQSRHYYLQLLNGINRELLFIDENYVILNCNDRFFKNTKYRKENTIGRHCYEVLHGYEHPCSENGETCKLKEVFKNKAPLNFCHKHLSKNGSRLEKNCYFSPVKDQQGKVVQAMLEISSPTNC